MRLNIIFITLFFCLGFLSGCGSQTRDPVVLQIDAIKITLGEFEEAFKHSYHAQDNTPLARERFLKELITRKLILNFAHNEGLDRDQEFLKDVELFWQQSLTKLVIDRKMRELSSQTRVSDKEVGDYYELHKQKVFEGKDLSGASQQIEWILLKEKQRAAIDAWIESLKSKTSVTVNSGVLGIDTP